MRTPLARASLIALMLLTAGCVRKQRYEDRYDERSEANACCMPCADTTTGPPSVTITPWTRPYPPNPLVLSISTTAGYTFPDTSDQHGNSRIVVMGFDSTGACKMTKTVALKDALRISPLVQGNNDCDLTKDQLDMFSLSGGNPYSTIVVWVTVNCLKDGEDPKTKMQRIEDVESWKTGK